MPVKPTVLVTSFYDRAVVRASLDRLSGIARVVLCDVERTLRREELLDRLAGVDAVIAAEERYDREVFERAPRLKMIARDGVGLDSIDLEAATAQGVIVTNAPVVHESVADLAMGLLLAVVRRIVIGDAGMRSGDWEQRARYLAPDVHGMCIGLLGFGAVGKAVARRAAAFGMRVMAYDVHPDKQAAETLGVELVEFDTLLAHADVLSLHVPLSEGTRGIIDARALGRMKRGAFLVNTSRGQVVREDDLFIALKNGSLGGAGLDVLCDEPPSAVHPLFELENVVVTPHVGSDTFGTFRRVFETAVSDLELFFGGARPGHIVNPAVLRAPQGGVP
jgi:lactate dehydrogenase-like 2-hydroxyacid dehydrogenase